MTILPKIMPRNEYEEQAKIERKLIRKEAKIGGQLFGSVPTSRHRQFFCLDEHTWIWHEEWQNSRGKRQAVTTRYEVRPNGILKIQDGHVYQRLSDEETRNLYNSAKLYYERVHAYYAKQLQTA
jgi:hypothetical protein